jgi:predicted small secreted protein
MMKRRLALLSLSFVVAACNTYAASKGNTSSSRVVGGMKQDAKAAGETIERSAQGIGDAINKALK